MYFAILVGAYQLLLGPNLGLSLKSLLFELLPAVTGCLALLAVTVPLRIWLAPQLPSVVTIFLVGGIGLGVYAIVLRLAFTDAWMDMSSLIVRAIPARARRRQRPDPLAEEDGALQRRDWLRRTARHRGRDPAVDYQMQLAAEWREFEVMDPAGAQLLRGAAQPDLAEAGEPTEPGTWRWPPAGS
jgi:hypothetical protein